MKEKIYCSNHPDRERKADCLICSKVVCENCINIIAGKAYCKSCGYGVISEAEILYLKRIYETIKGKKRLSILKDKRKHQRIRIVRSVEIYDGQKNKNIKGTIIDVSIGNLSIITDEQLHPRDNIKLSFTLGDEFQFMHIQGGVIRSEKVGEKYYVAIMLMNLGENREKLEDFVTGRLKRKYVREDIGYV